MTWTPADEAQAQGAFLGWFRDYMAQPGFMVGPDAVKAAFLAGAQWIDTLRGDD